MHPHPPTPDADDRASKGLLAEGDLRNRVRRRTLIMGIAMFVALTCLGAYFLLVSTTARIAGLSLRDSWLGLAAVLPMFVVFLTPLLVGERIGLRYAIRCPRCDADLQRRTRKLLATRLCPACEEHIVAGPTTKPSRYHNNELVKQRRFLHRWLWIWPACSLLALLIMHGLPSSAWPVGVEAALIPPLIGFTAGGYSWLRTGDSRYRGPAIYSLLLGVALAWSVFA